MRVLGVIASVVVASTLYSGSARAQDWTDFQVGGVTRRALVYVPSGINNPPLLISLHGRGIGAGWHQGGMMKFEPIADREKFIVVYPEALMDLNWDLGGTTDIEFVRTIIDDMATQHGADRNRVYASGFSMGGMFSYTLACKVPDLIAAIAPGNGYPLGPFGRFGCVDTRPVPIFHMHGTADDFVAYSGIHNYLQSWVTAYGCPTTPVETRPYPQNNAASMSFKETWGPCSNASGQQSEVVLVSVTGMIHDWASPEKANANEDPAFAGKPFDINGSEEAWAFLKNHSLTSGNPVMGTAGNGGEGGVAGSVAGSGGMDAGSGGVAGAIAGSGGTDGAGSGGNGGDAGSLAGSGGSAGMFAGSGGSFAGTGAAGQSAPIDPGTTSDRGCSCRVAGTSTASSGGGSTLLACVCLLLWCRFARRASTLR